MDKITNIINYIDDIIRNDPAILYGAKKEVLQKLQLLHYETKNIINYYKEAAEKKESC